MVAYYSSSYLLDHLLDLSNAPQHVANSTYSIAVLSIFFNFKSDLISGKSKILKESF